MNASVNKFKKLVTDVRYDQACAMPPSLPRSGEYLVDKGAGSDWRKTSTSWKNISTSFNLFFKSKGDGAIIDTYTSRHVVKKDIKTTIQSLGLSCGYIMRTTYYRHKEVKRNVTEMQTFVNANGELNQPVYTNYALVEYIFPDDENNQPLTPKKRKSTDSHNDLSGENNSHPNKEHKNDCAVSNDFHRENSYPNKEQKKNVAEAIGRSARPLPPFEASGLPQFLRSSWDNGQIILEKEGVTDHPFFKDTSLVISLTSQICHNVSYAKVIKCDCERFIRYNMCAHCIAAAHVKGNLDVVVGQYEFPSMSKRAVPANAGKKPGYKARKRVETRTTEDLQCNNSHFVEEECLKVCFLQDTRAVKCFGCGGALRQSLADLPPPPPFDIAIITKTYRHFREKATGLNPGKLHIKTHKENVYYHPQRACIKKQRDDIKNMHIDDAIKLNLQDVHHRLIWHEFGIDTRDSTTD